MVRTSLTRNEILLTPSPISIEVDGELDPGETIKTLGVRGASGRVECKGNVAVWAADSHLAPGHYTLSVDGLQSTSGERLSGPFEVPFMVVESRARVPDHVRVESFARVRIEELGTRRLPPFEAARGPYVELIKAVDRKTGAPLALAVDEAGRSVDVARLQGELARRRLAKYGKLHPHLHAQLASSYDNEPLHVAIWLRTEPAPLDPATRPTRGPVKEVPELARRQREALAALTGAFAERIESLGEATSEDPWGQRGALWVTRADEAAPLVCVHANRESLRQLEQLPEVAGIFRYNPTGVDDLDDSMAIANSDDVQALGQTGAGVRVAVWERGPDSTANLAIVDQFSASADTSTHSRHVHGIIDNTQAAAPNGHASGCLLHSANDYDLSALAWAVLTEECTVINQSFHHTEEATDGTQSFDDLYKDWLALNWPYPTIVQAAGNTGESGATISPATDEFVNHKGYNSLTVGNHDDTASAMSSTTVFRNPTTTFGDRELPEISANGTSVTAVGATLSGTSMASPAVAGVAALLQGADGTLEHWPEGCRAILLAGATRNVVGSTWWADVSSGTDAQDGSGAVNALESHSIVLAPQNRNNAGSQRGWDVGLLSSSDFDASGLSTFVYRVTVPGIFTSIFSPRHVKVALAWTSEITEVSVLGFQIPVASTLAVDLDLKIFDSSGVQVGYSGSWDNSYEIAEFTGTPGETYEIRIRRWSGTESTWYGIGWTVTGSLSRGILRLIAAGGPGGDDQRAG